MRVTIDKDVCIDCGICESLVPEVFLEDVPEDLQDAVREAEESCPTEAIEIIED